MSARPFALILAAALVPCAASAQETEWSYGALLATDYISDGESLSGHKPVIQGYVEVQHGFFYGGVWGSTLDDEGDHLEVELAVGIRPVIGDVELDLRYARTFYNKSGACCGEIALWAKYPLSDLFYITGEASYDFDAREVSAEAAGVFEYDLDEVWSVSAAVGADINGEEDEEDSISWGFGLARALGDNAWVDVSYLDSTTHSAHLVASTGFDF